jgi:hypothetical protein
MLLSVTKHILRELIKIRAARKSFACSWFVTRRTIQLTNTGKELPQRENALKNAEKKSLK